MAVFTKKQENSESLLSKASSILDIFQQTITGLTSVNDEAKSKIADEKAKIEAALVEKDKLESLVTNNDKVISKINSIFE